MKDIENKIESLLKDFYSENNEYVVEYSVKPIDIVTEGNYILGVSPLHPTDIEGATALKMMLEKFLKESNYTEKIHCQIKFLKKTDMEAQKQNKEQEEVKTFIPTKPRHTFDQIILPSLLKQEVEEAMGLIAHTDLIYSEWGFQNIDAVPKSVLNFYGPPGTGKTMVAHAIAHKLNKTFLALNYSEIESKYVGDAPKNLASAFAQAKKEDAVLFFDEADSFLGKRIENVSQGSDQAINSLRSQMLILLEDFSGIVIFATNLVSNFDKAFESRILKHLHFDLPNKEARKDIIKKMIPEKLPRITTFEEKEYEEMADATDGFSGREIKGAVLETLLKKALAAGKEGIFSSQDFLDRFTNKANEKKKLKEEESQKLKDKISNALKRKGEENKLEELRNCCQFGFHVMWADGRDHEYQKQILKDFIDSHQLGLTLPEKKEDLIDLDLLLNNEYTRENKINILDFMIKVLNVSYDSTDDTQNKIIEIMTKLKASDEVIEKLSQYTRKTTEMTNDFVAITNLITE